MLSEGDTLAGYLLGRVIGQGASGVVHLAWDPRTGGPVAIKLLSLDAAQAPEDREDMRRGFIEEARISMQIRHPDIVAVLAAGDHVGQLWQAMELAPGHALSRYAQPRYLLPPPVVLDIGVRIARALDHVHAQGIVHRDLKPSNVLVDLPRSIVKLTDFGTARLLDGSRTRTGVMLGTPAYMPPEQLAGAPATAAGDVYALGVLLFELLTSRRPHESASMGEFLRKVAAEPAPDLRHYWPDVPEPVAATIARTLSRRPADRPSTAGELADALVRVRLHGWGST